jgi:hypothetical protein
VALRSSVAATPLVSFVVAFAWLGSQLVFFRLENGLVDDALVIADHDGAGAADRLAPAGFQIAEDDRPAVSDLDHGFRRHIVHELGAGDLALNFLDDRDRGIGHGGGSQRQQADTHNNRNFHFGPHWKAQVV